MKIRTFLSAVLAFAGFLSLSAQNSQRVISYLEVYDLETRSHQVIKEFPFLIEAPNWTSDGEGPDRPWGRHQAHRHLATPQGGQHGPLPGTHGSSGGRKEAKYSSLATRADRVSLSLAVFGEEADAPSC